MDYLVLYIDVDYIVAAICSDDNCNLYPIKNGNDDFFSLYFYNDPYQNIVTCGKENKKHYCNGEVNYYGNFIELIGDVNNTFSIGDYHYPIIELLRYSKLIDKLKNAYVTKTHTNKKNIPTLITFSLSVNVLARQKLVEYFDLQGINIVSHTIPLSELTCFFTKHKNNVHFDDGNIVAFMEASNSDLHLMKLMFLSDYFLLDGKAETKKGLGIDPRKRALLKYVVSKIGTMGVLNEQEKEEEYKILELKTDEWLQKLDLQVNSCPVDVNEALSKMPNAKRRVLLYKEKIAEFTSSDIQLIIDNYIDYINRNVKQVVTAVILIGDCFQNEAIRGKIENIIGADKIYFYANIDIYHILSMYPKIDFTRYASEEARIKERAKAEELKQTEQRALEERQRKEQKEIAKNAAAEKKAEENRKEAKRLFELAVELDKKEKIKDSRINVENAVALDEGNKEYKQFYHLLNEKIKKLNQKTELYKKYLKKADQLFEDGDFCSALEEYEAAKYVFDNPEIIAKIIEVKRLVKHKEKKDAKIAEILTDTNKYIQKNDFSAAKEKVNTIASFDPLNVEAKKLLTKIDAYLKQEDKKFKEFVKTADEYFNTDNYEEAKKIYNQALMIKSDDKYCVRQMQKIVKAIDNQKENQKKCSEIIKKADKLFKDEKWGDAKEKYQIILDIFPQNSDVQNKIEQCHIGIEKQESIYKDYLMQAVVSEKKSKLNEALESLEHAQIIKPDDGEVKKRIKNIKFKLQFGDSDIPIKKNNTSKKLNDEKSDDFFLQKNTKSSSGNKQDKNHSFIEKNKVGSKDDDDFLGLNKAIKDDDDFLGKSDIG